MKNAGYDFIGYNKLAPRGGSARSNSNDTDTEAAEQIPCRNAVHTTTHFEFNGVCNLV